MDKQSRGWDDDSKLSVKRLAHAAEKAFAGRAVLHTEDGGLLIQNNEKRSRKWQPARKVGSAKVISYEDIIEAQNKGDVKNSSQTQKRSSYSTRQARAKRTYADYTQNAEDKIRS